MTVSLELAQHNCNHSQEIGLLPRMVDQVHTEAPHFPNTEKSLEKAVLNWRPEKGLMNKVKPFPLYSMECGIL